MDLTKNVAIIGSEVELNRITTLYGDAIQDIDNVKNKFVKLRNYGNGNNMIKNDRFAENFKTTALNTGREGLENALLQLNKMIQGNIF